MCAVISLCKEVRTNQR